MNFEPLVYALGWSLLHSLWQGALLCGIAYVLVSVFYLSSKEKANLLFTLLCLLLVGFVGTFLMYLPNERPIGKAEGAIMLSNYDYSAVFTEKKHWRLEAFFPHAAGIYIVGVMFQLFALCIGYLRISRLKNGERYPVSIAWQDIFSILCQKLQIKRNIGFYLSDKVQIPTVIGYFKPVILFPLAAVTALDLKQVESILIHEISHIRRNDYILNLVKCLIEAVLFFNPFVWMLGRLLEKEREHSCDDQVLQITGNALTYAQALLVLENIRSRKLPVFALGAFNKKEYLLERIKRMTMMKTNNNFHIRHKLAAMTFLLAGIIGLAWTGPVSDPVKDTVLKVVKEPRPPVPPAPSVAPPTPDTVAKKSDPNKAETLFTSPEWKKLQSELSANGKAIGEEVAAVMHEQFNSAEWKTFMKEVGEHSQAIVKETTFELFDSPEWKETMREVQEHAQQMGLSALNYDTTYFDSPEWKLKEKEMEERTKKLENMSKQLVEKVNSDEMKAKREALERKAEELAQNAEALQQKFESPEFKAKQEALQQKAEELTKKAEILQHKAERMQKEKQLKE
ncbi:hypothetical protein H8S90_05210 [Olivibacter sp. SDN3]|uniref:M56 family metallopeptidase n=1 Tax=Olivibacter sp. SDN3 TaxID=2764720 RepID=UPI0016516405|nr:M56 family metallopeptidase [Olivibacter sp. SDN3]QNL50990.1 hypothetical protein H8S90_05210 [Olivibacter sp. SDN3]